jgi:hypothetical protein
MVESVQRWPAQGLQAEATDRRHLDGLDPGEPGDPMVIRLRRTVSERTDSAACSVTCGLLPGAEGQEATKLGGGDVHKRTEVDLLVCA